MIWNASTLLVTSWEHYLLCCIDVSFFLSFFFGCGPFSQSLTCYNTVSVLCFVFLAMRHVGSLLSDQRVKPAPPALEGRVLITRPPGKFPWIFFRYEILHCWLVESEDVVLWIERKCG